MQVESPASTRFVPERAAHAGGAVSVPHPITGKAIDRRSAVLDTSAPVAVPVRKGLRAWDPGYNLQLASAQQTLDFLGDVAGKLQVLGTAIKGALAGGSRAEDGTLNAALHELVARWDERGEATARSLDGQLAFGARGQARQSFRIPGLDVHSLQAQAQETLFFSVAGAGRQAIPVTLDPALPSAAQVRHMDLALFPAGIRVTANEQGDLLFDVPEAQWEAVRGTLAIRGGGMRYPAGQMHLVRPQAVASAVTPEQWRMDDLHGALRDVAAAQGRVRQARQDVSRELADAADRPEIGEAGMGGAVMPSWAADFSREFRDNASSSDYRFVASVAPALTGISRERVVSLLALRTD
ncbi:hypothetical protein AAFF27_20770 [Xylophilus sp. GW821-FHT01B05]